MNKDRRKVIANIFADAAKYTLTAGVIGNFLSGKYDPIGSAIIGTVVVILGILAYFVTPKDKKEEKR